MLTLPLQISCPRQARPRHPRPPEKRLKALGKKELADEQLPKKELAILLRKVLNPA